MAPPRFDSRWTAGWGRELRGNRFPKFKVVGLPTQTGDAWMMQSFSIGQETLIQTESGQSSLLASNRRTLLSNDLLGPRLCAESLVA